MNFLPTFIPSAEVISRIFSNAAAPAFLLFGIFSLTSILSVRLNTVMLLLRSLADSVKADNADRHTVERFKVIKRRCLLLASALRFACYASISTLVLITLMVASSFLGMPHAFGAPFLFAIATIFLLVTITKFVRELRLEAQEISSYSYE
jgi:Protein of unknown function (DUF2721)